MRAETKIQSNNCNPAKTKRPPFNDITNMFNTRMDSEVHPELAPPSRASKELAMDRENSSETFGGAPACYNFPGTSVQHQRPVQPPLPPSLPLSTVSHLRSESLGHKSSRRLNSSDARTQRLRVPDFDVGSSVSHLPSRDLPATEAPFLPSLSESPGREPLSTSLLSPKTHKLAHGQLVILPSRSVLVDFREGERRKGRKGDEVMVVSPIGDQVTSHLRDRRTLLRKIKILLYSAPHLSTPCCLAEPVATYSLNELPADWYRLYEQAKKVIEHIKRNVPKFVMYEGTFVCTLMANEPRADVEIRASSRSTTSAISGSTTAASRVRFSRKLRTMQIFSSAPRVSKKTMFCTARGVPVDAEDWALLSNYEKECLAALLDFLRTVEVLEGVPRGKPETLSTTSTELPPKCLTARDATLPAHSAVTPCHGGDTISPRTSPPKSATPTLLPPSSRSIQVTVSPRPRFPSALPRATGETFRRASSTAVSDAPPSRASPLSSANCAPNSESLHDLSRPRLQTRFIPGVGWCVRSGGTQYRIMFQDGVALEVDVDEERVELVEHDGSVTRLY
ncbi:hypothetical protein EDB87DRAFT_1749629 [Lactarius vividus]|nr:hypothetical protein EDB87DRAFT_1749629 [Lactarius vividus]